MPRGALLAYSLTGVLRARRRSFIVLAGLSLAVATIVTPALSLDSEVRALVGRAVSSIPYDFHSFGTTSDAEGASAAAASVDGVVGTEPVLLVASGGRIAGIRGPDGQEVVRSAFGFAFVRPSFARFSSRFGFSGSFELANGSLALPDRLAGRIHAGVGDTVLVWNLVSVCEGRPPLCHEENRTASYPVGGVLETPLGPDAATPFRISTASYPREDMVFAGFDTFPTIRADVGLAAGNPPPTVVLVWADRGRIVDPYSPEATEAAVLHLLRNLIVVGLSWGVSYQEATDPNTGSTLVGAVRSATEGLTFQLELFILLALPALGLSLVYARIGFEVGLARRRREIGILRSRGWSARGILASLLLEALLLGAIAAAVGFAVAVLVSRAFLGLASASFPGGLPIAFADVPVSPATLGIAVAAAVAGAFLVAFPLVRQVASMRIVRALHFVSPVETALTYRNGSSYALIALGGIGVVSTLGYHGISSREGLLPLFLDVARTFLILLSPFVTILGLAQITSLGSRRPFRALARLVRPWTGDLHFLVAEGLRRHPRRSAHLTAIVAFGLTYAMFVAAFIGVLEVSEVRAARTAVGGDLYFDSAKVLRTEYEALNATSGVDAVAVADLIPSNYGTILAINGSEYVRAVPWLDAYYFVEGGPSSIGALASGGAIPDETLARGQGLSLGDPLVVIISGPRASTQIVVHVAAIVRSLPGLPTSREMHWPYGSVAIDYGLLRAQNLSGSSLAFPGRRAIMHAATGWDPRLVARNLTDRWDGTAVVFDDVLAGLRADPFRAALFAHLYTQAGLAVIVLVVAVSVTAFASGTEREGEFATICARGVGGRGLAALLFGEGLAVGILGTVLAVPAALLFLAVFLQFLSGIGGTAPMEFVVPWPAWALVVGGLAATAVGTAFAGLRLRRIDLPRVLKLQGL